MSRCASTRWTLLSANCCSKRNAGARIGTYILCVFLVDVALADTHTWTDGSLANSNWSEPNNWSPVGPPAFGDDVIVTPGALGGAGPAVVDVLASIANLQVIENLFGEGEVQILAGKDLVINGGDLENDGLIVVNSDGGSQAARLRFSAYLGDNLNTLSGNGTILLQAGSQSFPTTVSPATIDTISSVVTQEAGHTIRGVGLITASMVNNGSILAADLPAAPGANVLVFSGSGITNNGTLGTEAGGTLDITGTYSISQGAGGVVSAANGGTVQLRNTIFITGGKLQTKGSGLVVSSSSPSGQFSTRLTNVTNEGTYQVNGGATAFIAGSGLTNDGTVNLFGTMNYLNNGALSGAGAVVLSGAGVIDNQVGVTITQAAGHTIRGSGQVNALLINEGVIQADGTLRLVFDPITNNHEIRVASGGTLQIENHVTQNPSTGLIIAEDGGTVKLLNSGRVIEGRLQSVGSGLIQAGDGTRLFDVVNEGTIHVQPITSVGQLNIEGSSLTNNSTIVVNPSGQGGTFRLSFCCDPQMTLDGGGFVDLNATNATLMIASGTVLTNAAGHRIEGPGRIEGELVNQGFVTGGTLGGGSVDMIQVAGRLSGTGGLKDVRITGTHAPGLSTGIAPASGIYELTFGTLEIEIGGTTPGTGHDAVQSTGSVMINNATLDVALTGGYMPNPSDSFAVVTATGAGGISGTGFATQNLPDLPGGLFFHVDLGASAVTLSVEGVLGDYNLDGTVNAADYAVWRAMDGQSGSGLAADGSRDGIIDNDDYDVWLAAFGQVAPGHSSGSSLSQIAVPEPTTILLTVLAVGSSLFRRFRVARRLPVRSTTG